MRAYKEYLKREKYSDSSIKSYVFLAEKFHQWTDTQKIFLTTFNYTKATEYVHFLKETKNTIRTINHKLSSMEVYFNYLLDAGEVTTNSFMGVRVKGEPRNKLLHNLLSSDELEDLYYSYNTEVDKHPRRWLINKRNKVIIGLLVYQGLGTSELRRLELEHLEVRKGKIYVPRGRIGNRRTLELKPWQIMDFIEYLNEIRPQLLPNNNQELTEVFIAKKLADTISLIAKKLKKINHKVEGVKQIRASVIVNWLSTYNLREVQILAGHKYISTTERYVQEDLQQLQEMVQKFHPLQ
ncbi:tyrosine-type recombinase/integrase [Tenacibaculum halocynthiae]|uniref:tyrosine-type recombinase/integrase n=1 Tax=Tenacibaculum halocynthiae TaxID=1254437 RepID=UPI003D649542